METVGLYLHSIPVFDIVVFIFLVVLIKVILCRQNAVPNTRSVGCIARLPQVSISSTFGIHLTSVALSVYGRECCNIYLVETMSAHQQEDVVYLWLRENIRHKESPNARNGWMLLSVFKLAWAS